MCILEWSLGAFQPTERVRGGELSLLKNKDLEGKVSGCCGFCYFLHKPIDLRRPAFRVVLLFFPTSPKLGL